MNQSGRWGVSQLCRVGQCLIVIRSPIVNRTIQCPEGSSLAEVEIKEGPIMYWMLARRLINRMKSCAS